MQCVVVFDYVEKPSKLEEISITIEKALEKRELSLKTSG